MADNTTLNAGSGGDVIATDDIAGVKVQRVKVQYGVDGSATDVSDTNPLPVDDAGGSLTVDNGGTFAVQEDGAALTALQTIDDIVHAEDSAHASGHSGALALAVRRDTAASGTSLDGDYATVNVDASGRVWVHDPVSVALLTTIDTDTSAMATSLAIIDDWDESDRAKVNPIAGQAGVAGGSGVVGATTQRVVLATDVALPAGDNNVGNVDIVTVPAPLNVTGGGTEASALRVTIASDSSGVVSIDDNGGSLTVDGTVTAAGGAAHDAPVAGNPNLIAGYASAAAPANVSLDGDAVRAWFLQNGAQATVLTAAGALIGGDATNGLDVDVTRVQGTVTVDTELPTAAALADNTANPTVPGVGAFVMGFDGSTWDRLPGTSADGLLVNLGTNNDVTVTSGSVTATGAAAHDAAVSGNPTRIGARAQTSDFTAVATGDTVDLLSTILGKQVVLPHALPGNFWSYAAASGGITNTTGVTAKAAGAAGVRNYITHVSVVNGGAEDTDVQIRDGASGTVLWRSFAKAGGGGVSDRLDPPLRGSAATLVEVACGTTGSATYFNLQGYTAAE